MLQKFLLFVFFRLGKTEAVADVIERGSELARQYIKSSPTTKAKDEEIAEVNEMERKEDFNEIF